MKGNDNRPRRVVIVGAGFGGIYTYLTLHRLLHGTGKIEITFINDTDHFTFVPLIHEVATGTLLPSSVSYSMRTLPQCCMHEFIEGRATHVDLDAQRVTVVQSRLATGNDGHSPNQADRDVEYDYLVLGIGSETNFFNVPGAQEHALELKSLDDATRMKNHIIERYQEAQRLSDPREQRDMLRVAIVGGGPTGVEIAGELADLMSHELADAFRDLKNLGSIVVIDRGERLMAQMAPWFSENADRILKRKGEVIHMHMTSAKEVTTKGLDTDKGFIKAGTVIWGGGVRARELPMRASHRITKEEKSGRIHVDEYLRIFGYENVYVVGDMAWIESSERDQPYPMRAQFAVREGKKAGENIVRDLYNSALSPFQFREKAFIVTLGKGGAIADVFGFRFTGPIGWIIYRGAYLASAVGARAKIRIFVEWMIGLFMPRDISKF